MSFIVSQLHSLRPPLPDVPAIYFVSPTLSNIRRIAEDLQKGLYESYHLNFVEPLPRALLEELASSVAQDGTSDLVEQVRIHLVLSFCFLLMHLLGCRPIPFFHRTFVFFVFFTSTSFSSCGCYLAIFYECRYSFILCHSQFSFIH